MIPSWGFELDNLDGYWLEVVLIFHPLCIRIAVSPGMPKLDVG